MASAHGYEGYSPPRYHRSSLDLCHLPTHTGSRSGTPRSSSALDRKWVHRSHGDLTADTDLQISYPRSSFYQDLYRKYPRAFQHRRESRELGRKLFNSQHHVRFEDDVDMADDRSVTSLRSARSERPLTNWDKEVGLYLGHRSRSRMCMTSAEPSEAGSVLSVKQRLQQNSNTLNRLLNEKSPLRRRFAESETRSHYDSGTENEQPLNYHKPEKQKFSRPHQRRVLQRKIDNKENGALDIVESGDSLSGRKSVPLLHQRPRNYKRYLPKIPQKPNRHVDVNALVTNTDLKIDTLLEKMKISSLDSPPDSAIDVDTPSVQSAVTTYRGTDSDCLHLICSNSPSSSSKGISELSSSNDSGLTNSCDSKNGRQCSDHNVLLRSQNDTTVEDPLKDKDNLLLLQEYGMLNEETDEDQNNNFVSNIDDNYEHHEKKQLETIDTAIDRESKQMQEIVNNFTQAVTHGGNNSEAGQGLVQLLGNEISNSSLNIHENRAIANELSLSSLNMHENIAIANETPHSSLNMYENIAIAKETSHSSLNINENIAIANEISNSSSNIHENIAIANEIIAKHSHESTPTNGIEVMSNSNSNGSETWMNNGSVIEKLDGKTTDFDVLTKVADVGDENLNYQADDEEDAHEDNLQSTQPDVRQHRAYHRDSDGSGIGQSSTGTRSPMTTLPPRGRARQRAVTSRTQPVRADHTIIRARPDADSSILNEVNFVQLSHNLEHDLKTRGAHSNGYRGNGHNSSQSEEKDDTTPQEGIAKVTAKEQNLAARYRRLRSPSPFVVKSRCQESPRPRPQSAPSFCQGDNEMCFVNISLSNENISDVSSKHSDRSKSDVEHRNAESNSLSMTTDKKTYENNIGAVDDKTQKSKSEHLHNDFNFPVEDKNPNSKFAIVSSSPIQQRKYSSSSCSTSSVCSCHNLKVCQMEENGGELRVKSNYHHRARSVNGAEIVNVSEIKSKSATCINELRDKTEMLGDMEPTGATHAGHVTDGYRYSTNDINTGASSIPRTEHEVGHTDEYITEVRGIYRPSVTSPRVKAKRLKLKSMFKNKKGSFNPGAVPVVTNDRNIVNRIYGREPINDPSISFQQGGNTQDIRNGMPVVNESDVIYKTSGRRYQNSPMVLPDKDLGEVAVKELDATECELTQVIIHKELGTEEERSSWETSRTGSRSQAGNTTNIPANGTNRDYPSVPHVNTVTAKPILINSRNVDRSRPIDKVADSHSTGVPVPPVRTKARRNNLPEDLNFSKYKIKAAEGPLTQKTNLNSMGDRSLAGVTGQSGTNQSHDQTRLSEQPAKGGQPVSRPAVSATETKDIEVLPVEKSNLEKSKNMSASKISLFDKMGGGLKSATKGKFKAIRKAMSLERGIDQVGKFPQGEKSGASDSKKGDSGFPHIRKAPSLKSITSLFGRKKKKGKVHLDTAAGNSRPQPLSNSKCQQWLSCDSLTTPRQPMGRLLKINLDGSQVIELTKQDQGPLGFFIARGNQQYKNGIFVSRFSNDGPERMLAGLMGVGDEILEINSRPVYDLALDTVYQLMTAGQTIVLKIFPLIARIDV